MSLKNIDLYETKSQLIQEKLSEFKAFLKSDFCFTSARYYTETWMVYGMIFGASKDAKAKNKEGFYKHN